MTVRAKVKLGSITRHAGPAGAKTLKFYAEYDTSIPEDQRFAKATPSASFEMYVDNPALEKKFQLGEYYYVDFTPVNPPPAKQPTVKAW